MFFFFCINPFFLHRWKNNFAVLRAKQTIISQNRKSIWRIWFCNSDWIQFKVYNTVQLGNCCGVSRATEIEQPVAALVESRDEVLRGNVHCPSSQCSRTDSLLKKAYVSTTCITRVENTISQLLPATTSTLKFGKCWLLSFTIPSNYSPCQLTQAQCNSTRHSGSSSFCHSRAMIPPAFYSTTWGVIEAPCYWRHSSVGKSWPNG